MQTLASTIYSLEPDSAEAGRLAAQKLKEQFGTERLRAALVYATMNHDHAVMTLPKMVITISPRCPMYSPQRA
jgi:hypothetical protein